MLGRVMREVLTDEELGLFLTSKMGATGSFTIRDDGCRCFYGVLGNNAVGVFVRSRGKMLGGQFEELCKRFGDPRIVAAIRSRALSILAQRRLKRTEPAAPTHRDSVVGCASEGTVTQR